MDHSEAQFLDALYRGVLDATEFKRALNTAQGMFDCCGGAFISIENRDPVATISAMTGIFEEHGRQYASEFIKIDPAPAIFARLATGTASTTDRLMTSEERRSLPFFNEFFVPIGLTETLGANLFRDQARFSLLGLQRGDDRQPFDDNDIARMERLLPHVARALQLRRAFVRIETKALLLQAAIDRMPAGLVLLDLEGTAIYVNATMQRIGQRAEEHGVSIDRTGRPLIANLAARQRFDALVADTASGGSGGVFKAPRNGHDRDYVVLVAPSPASLSGLEWDRSGHASCLILVHDPEARTKSAAEILKDALNLPNATARLVAALAADDDLKSFAEREGVTINTLRFHLHTAFPLGHQNPGRSGAACGAAVARLRARRSRRLITQAPPCWRSLYRPVFVPDFTPAAK